VAFVLLEADPDPVRVRAAWVSDEDIRAMADQCIAHIEAEPGLLAIEAGAAA
jgi:S-DNA-T family DNA segregation ATPase FtsK/SpoIIIE